MGRTYLFQCSKCGYRARVSGCADAGLDFSVQTIACRDCRALFDAVVRWRVAEGLGLRRAFGWQELRKLRRATDAAPGVDSVLNRLPQAGERGFRWLEFNLRCPVSKLHRVRAWNDPDKCPRCGVFLEKNGLPFRIWE